MRSTFFSKWWPDQVAGALLVCNFTIALSVGETAIKGTGIGLVLPHWAMLTWFAGFVIAGAWVVVGTGLDRPRCTAVALAVAGVLFAMNGLYTISSPKGSAALSASTAYLLATIYLLERSRLAWTLAEIRAGARKAVRA